MLLLGVFIKFVNFDFVRVFVMKCHTNKRDDEFKQRIREFLERVRVHALRIASMDKILCFTYTLVIIIVNIIGCTF